jgi:prepilin-type N-terminal cleavage/methylation domain-containing protein
MKTSRAFTLIELLIVIAIIGILMSLLFPAVNSAIDAARKAQSKNDVTQIATAVIAYETEYGKLPTGGASGDVTKDVDGDLMKILTGVTGNTNNPREIVFLEANQAKRGKSGTNASGAFVDPWSILETGGDTPYKITMDGSYDNSISAGNPSVPLRKKVAVWSEPKGTTPKQMRRAVTSWD